MTMARSLPGCVGSSLQSERMIGCSDGTLRLRNDWRCCRHQDLQSVAALQQSDVLLTFLSDWDLVASSAARCRSLRPRPPWTLDPDTSLTPLTLTRCRSLVTSLWRRRRLAPSSDSAEPSTVDWAPTRDVEWSCDCVTSRSRDHVAPDDVDTRLPQSSHRLASQSNYRYVRLPAWGLSTSAPSDVRIPTLNRSWTKSSTLLSYRVYRRPQRSVVLNAFHCWRRWRQSNDHHEGTWHVRRDHLRSVR